MAYIVRMPKLGLEMESGTLLEWMVEQGGHVDHDEVIAEIESEKTTAEVESREDGVLRRVFLDVGDDVPPGTPIGVIAEADEAIDALLEEAEADLADGTGESEESDTGTGASDATSSEPTESEASETTNTVRATPRARKRAEELDITLASVEGSGPQGAVSEEDVEAAAEASGGDSTQSVGAPRTLAEEHTLGGMRQTIAKRLSESYREAVHVTEHRKADAGALLAAVDAAEDALDVEVSMTDVLLLALSAALDEHPAFNATFEDDTHRLWEEHNVCTAVDVEAGLVAPVLPTVNEKSLVELAEERRELTQRTLDGDYTSNDLQGGTFTVTNLGVLGVESFDPVINPPQVAILGVDAILEDVRVADDGSVASHPVLPLDLSFDHRVVDGADAARFLGSLVEHLEDPGPLLPDAVEVPGGAVGTAASGERRHAVATSTDGMSGTVDVAGIEQRYGGGDPTPVELFLGSLAACLSLSVRYQARFQNAPVESVEVVTDAPDESGSVESIDVTVVLDAPDVEDDVLDRIVEQGEQNCHVSELLRTDLPVEIDWERA